MIVPSRNETRRPPGIGDHSRWHLEDDHSECEEGVGGERLGVGQPGVEQEEGVHPQMNDAASVLSSVRGEGSAEPNGRRGRPRPSAGGVRFGERGGMASGIGER